MMTQTKSSYQQSPYMTLNRRKLRAISNELRKSLKIQEIIDNNCNNNSNSNINTTENDEKEPLLTQDEETLEISTTTNISSFQEDTSESDSLPVIYEKAHMFKVNNFKGFHWCELCGNFLW